MKKTILLALLAGSMLASCATAAKVNVNNAKVNGLANIFEDCEAHDEIFGKQTLPFVNAPKAAPIDPIGGDATIRLGVQTATFGSGESERRAVRFIAAIRVTDADDDGDVADDLAATEAVWTRGIYDTYGTAAKDETEPQPCASAYTSLNNGGVEYSISDLNTALSTSYTHFVVYTIGGIPMDSAYSKYYLTAYVTITDQNDAETESKAVVTTIDETTQFTLATSLLQADGCFGLKKEGSTYTNVPASVSNPNAGDGNLAEFTDLTLTSSQGFVAIRRSVTNQRFNVSGFQKMTDAGSVDKKYYKALGTAGSADFVTSIYNSAKVSFYMGASYGNVGKLYLGTVYSVNVTLYLTASATDWSSASVWFALFYQNTSSHTDEMSTTATEGVYSITVNIDPTKSMAFIRMNPGSDHGTALGDCWNKTHNWGQTVDYYLCDQAAKNKLDISGKNDGGDGKYWGTWSVQA